MPNPKKIFFKTINTSNISNTGIKESVAQKGAYLKRVKFHRHSFSHITPHF